MDTGAKRNRDSGVFGRAARTVRACRGGSATAGKPSKGVNIPEGDGGR